MRFGPMYDLFLNIVFVTLLGLYFFGVFALVGSLVILAWRTL